MLIGRPSDYLICAFRLLHHIMLLPAQQIALQSPDHGRERHAHQHQHDHRDHHSGRFPPRLRLDDQASNSPLRTDEFADDDADQRKGDRRGKRGKHPGHRRGNYDRAGDLPLLAPSSRATLTKPSSIERAPSNVLKNTRNTTTIHEVTTFEMSPIPNASTMI